ncbi:MAG: hypothetical protein U9M89_03365, partial [Patescibacteria group bacterium]|nr:hypothetical protein [Patescibacteria group bacterium]
FPIPRDWDLSFVIDPHPQKATAWNLFAESPDGKIYIIDEADIEGDVEQICQVIRARCADKRIGWQMIDPAAGEQGARIHGRGKLIDEFRKHLPKIVKAKNAVYPGVNAVQQLVADGPGGPRLQTFRSCPVTHFQMKNLSWKGPTPTGEDRKRAEIVKRNEDHCDCVRYRIYTAPPGQSIQNVSFNIGVYAN